MQADGGMLCFVGSHFDIWHRYQRSSFTNEEPGFYMYSQITVTEIYRFKTLSQTVKSFYAINCLLIRFINNLGFFFKAISSNLISIITQPSIYGVIVYFLLCHESMNYSIGQ